MPLPLCAPHVLSSIADALYPPPLGPPHSSDTLLSTLPLYMTRLLEGINCLPANEVLETTLLLHALNTAVGTALIFMTPTATSFPLMPISTRQALLNKLKKSRLQDKRKIFQGLKRITMGTALSYSVYSEEQLVKGKEGGGKFTRKEVNPMWETIDYPGPPIVQEEKEPVITPDYSFPTKHSTTTYDYVVVGSGSGGGVAAATIMEANPSATCLVIEKGTPVTNSSFSQVESHGMGKFYEKKSLLTSSDGHMMILAGSCLGGGSTINWGCSLDTPAYVRDEWSGELKLPQFNSKEYDDAMDHVKARMGVHSDVTHNGMNERLIEGSDKLGYEWKVCPQNIKDTKTTSAGWTCFGSRQGNKQGGTNTWLRDYCDAGGEITYGSVLTVAKKGKTVAVRIGEEGDTEVVTFTAMQAVIVAAGSLCTPCVLERSGFKNGNIGKNLRLHPVTGVFADCTPDESEDVNEKPVDGYCGAPMTTVVTSFEMGVDNDGYGYKLECPSAHTGVMAAAFPWADAEHFKTAMAHGRNCSAVIVLQRDVGGGTVVCGPDGFSPKVDYVLNAADSKNVVHGLHKGFDLLRNVASVRKITTLHPSQKTHSVGKDDPAAFHKQIDELGTEVNGLGMFCAHQMGSCRMGSDPYSGAVDEDGELWEAEGVYVMDASVFPTASGANPMISTMSISRMLALRLVNKTGKGREERRAKWKGKEAGDGGRRGLGMGMYAMGLAGVVVAWLAVKGTGWRR